MQNQGKIIKHSLWLQFSCNFTQTVTSKEIWANVVPVYVQYVLLLYAAMLAYMYSL